MARYEFTIDRWRPPSKNELFRGTLQRRMRLQKQAAEMVAAYGMAVPKATGPRRVSVRFVYPKRQRMHDVDAFFASLLDALTSAGLIAGDAQNQVSLGPWTLERGSVQSTIITLEDIILVTSKALIACAGYGLWDCDAIAIASPQKAGRWGWKDIEADDENPLLWTHVGHCPECQERYQKEYPRGQSS
jgi:hypothetical protein